MADSRYARLGRRLLPRLRHSTPQYVNDDDDLTLLIVACLNEIKLSDTDVAAVVCGEGQKLAQHERLVVGKLESKLIRRGKEIDKGIARLVKHFRTDQSDRGRERWHNLVAQWLRDKDVSLQKLACIGGAGTEEQQRQVFAELLANAPPAWSAQLAKAKDLATKPMTNNPRMMTGHTRRPGSRRSSG